MIAISWSIQSDVDMFSNWKIDNNSKKPKYIQIEELISKDIISGRIQEGSKLPSERKLMDIFNVSRNTIIGAVSLLEEKSLVKIYPQSGIVVESRKLQNQSPNWKRYFERGKHKAGSIERLNQLSAISNAGRDVINISAEGFGTEFNILTPLFKDILSRFQNSINIKFSSYDKYGYLPLRELIAERVKSDGINTTPAEILIMPSVRQSLNTICMALLEFGANFIYSKPNVINLETVVHSLGANMVSISMGDEGIDLQLLENAIRRDNSILYANPTSHNPTGKILSLERKLAVLDIVNKRRVPIIEVDSQRDLYIDKPYPLPFMALDKTSSVIYLNSIPRTHTLNIGVSWCIAPAVVLERLADVKVQHDIYPSMILQLLAYELLNSGHYDNFLKEVRPILVRKRNLALQILDNEFKGIASYNREDCNSYIWIKFIDEVDTKLLFEAMTDVEFSPGFFYDKSDRHHIQIAPPSVTDDELIYAMGVIRKEIKQLFGV